MNTKGQSLIELVLCVPLFVATWAAIIYFIQAIVISTALLLTARHGIFWLAEHNTPASASSDIVSTETECRRFWTRLVPGKPVNELEFRIQPGDVWKPNGPRNLMNIADIMRITFSLSTLKASAGLMNFRPASVTVTYHLPVSRVLRVIPGFPPSIPLRGSCVCYR